MVGGLLNDAESECALGTKTHQQHTRGTAEREGESEAGEYSMLESGKILRVEVHTHTNTEE